MSVSQKIIDTLDSLDIFCSQVGQGLYAHTRPEYECEFWSDAGEDFVFYIEATDDKEFVNQFDKYACNFDPDDHAAMYISMRGHNGLPDSIQELIDDSNDIKEFLQHAAKKLRKDAI